MQSLKNILQFFKTDDLASRILSISCLFTLTVISCYYHGVSERNRTIDVINKMIDEGELHGTFWRIKNQTSNYLIVAKFGFEKKLIYGKKNVYTPKSGEKVSFIARKLKKETKNATLWKVNEIHFHDSSSKKFIVSIIPVVIIGWMVFRYLEIDKKALTINFKSR